MMGLENIIGTAFFFNLQVANEAKTDPIQCKQSFSFNRLLECYVYALRTEEYNATCYEFIQLFNF